MALGREAAKRKVKCFVELSTGMVYKSESTPRKETDKLKPWSNLAKWKVKAEEDLAAIEGLNVMVMRMAHVYGPYTSKFLSTALCMARVYQSKKKEMKWLWKEDLRTNTVHIDDTVRALWHGAEWYSKGPSPRKPAPIFNIVDHGNTCKSPKTFLGHFPPLARESAPSRFVVAAVVAVSVGTSRSMLASELLPTVHIRSLLSCFLNIFGKRLTDPLLAQGHTAKLVHEVFGIETGFHGTLISAFARLNLDHVVDDVNDETLDPWAELQQAAGISQSTPLSPFMEKELLREADLCLDGTKFEQTVGFK